MSLVTAFLVLYKGCQRIEMCFTVFGLSIERPILDHHPKAHIHEIRRISPWNLADFTMKSGGFHHEIWRISWNLWNPWNPVDFTMKSSRFQVKSTPNLIKSDVWAKTLLMFQQKLFWFYKVWVDFTWNPPDFMRISCEIERPLARNCNPMFWLLRMRQLHVQ